MGQNEFELSIPLAQSQTELPSKGSTLFVHSHVAVLNSFVHEDPVESLRFVA